MPFDGEISAFEDAKETNKVNLLYNRAVADETRIELIQVSHLLKYRWAWCKNITQKPGVLLGIVPVTQRCVLGALDHFQATQEVHRAILRQIEPLGFESIPSWNDDPTTSHRMVKTVLANAIDAMRLQIESFDAQLSELT